jgi:hypothetical protein
MGENPLFFLKSKVKIMEISKEMRAAVKPACWGAAGGAIALAIIGFTWGGWVTGGHAKTLADAAAALVPICADKFQAGGALALSTLKAEKDDRDYDDIVIKFVQKVGDRIISTSDRPFAKACGLEVMKRDKEAGAKSASK